MLLLLFQQEVYADDGPKITINSLSRIMKKGYGGEGHNGGDTIIAKTFYDNKMTCDLFLLERSYSTSNDKIAANRVFFTCSHVKVAGSVEFDSSSVSAVSSNLGINGSAGINSIASLATSYSSGNSNHNTQTCHNEFDISFAGESSHVGECSEGDIMEINCMNAPNGQVYTCTTPSSNSCVIM